MYLIFVRYFGDGYNRKKWYEFLFADNTDLDNVEGWDVYPANGAPSIPIEYVSESKQLETDINFILAQDSQCFDRISAVEGIVALCWEDTREYDEEQMPDRALFFHFGEELSSVEKKLYNRDLKFKINTR